MIIYYYILLYIIIYYYIIIYHNHYSRINLRFQYIWMVHIFKKSCCTVALLHWATGERQVDCASQSASWWICLELALGLLHGGSNLVKLCWRGNHVTGYPDHNGCFHNNNHRRVDSQLNLKQLNQLKFWMCWRWTSHRMEPIRSFWLQLLPRTRSRVHKSIGVLRTCCHSQRMLLLWLEFAATPSSTAWAPWAWDACPHPECQSNQQSEKWRHCGRHWALSFWDALRCSEVRGKWSCELRKENVGSTCWQYSTTGWSIHPWPWLQWSGSGEFANFRPFFGMWQCLKVDLRFTWFTWFTWFTILFCVLHFYILVRISSNVGFWIRFDLCMAFLPHITSASATARGGTAILGLCIARPSSSTAHAAPGLRCGRFQLTLALRANPLLVAITGF